MSNLYLDSKIPKTAGQLSLNKLPKVAYFDYSAVDLEFHDSEIMKPCTISLDGLLSSPLDRLSGWDLDMSWKLVQRDSINGVAELVLGRQYSQSTPQLSWVMNSTLSDAAGLLTAAPAIAPAASEILSKDTATLITAIKTHFMEAGDKVAEFTPAFRSDLRQLLKSPFNLKPVLWRLAVLWYLSSWGDQIGTPLRSHVANDDLAPLADCVAHAQFISLVRKSASQELSPVCHMGSPDPTHNRAIIGVMRFALSNAWAHNLSESCSTLCTNLPPVPRATVVNCSTAGVYEAIPGLIDGHLVWEVASTFAAQHGITTEWAATVREVGLLWLSPVAGLGAITLSAKQNLVMGSLRSASTVLLPLSLNSTSWMMAGLDLTEPDFPTMVTKCCQDSIMLGCCYRLVGMLHGMPLTSIMESAQKEAAAYYRASLRYGALHTQTMIQAAGLMRTLGGGGTLGHLLSTLTPNFSSIGECKLWWSNHAAAYQWDELVPILRTLPDNSAMSGIFDPLITTTVAIVNKWYGVENSIAQRVSTPHAMQRLIFKKDVEVGIAVTASADGSRNIYLYDMPASYRGAVSDWIFFGPFMRHAAAAELVFRIRSIDTALELMHGPVGFDSRQYYIADLLGEDIDGIQLMEASLGFDLGPSSGSYPLSMPSGPIPPGAAQPPSGLPDDHTYEVDMLRKASGLPPPPLTKSTGGLDDDAFSPAESWSSYPKHDEESGGRDDQSYEEEEPAPTLRSIRYNNNPPQKQARADVWKPITKAPPGVPSTSIIAEVPKTLTSSASVPAVEVLGNQVKASPMSDTLSVASSASGSSKATVKSNTTTTTLTRTDAGRINKAKVVTLDPSMDYKQVLEGIHTIGTPAERVKRATTLAELMGTGKPAIVALAKGASKLYTQAALDASADDINNIVYESVKALNLVNPSELLAGLPRDARRPTALLLTNQLKELASVAQGSSAVQAVNLATNYASAAAALSRNSALTPNELIAEVGRARWDACEKPIAAIEQALVRGVPVTQAFPVEYTRKGKDFKRKEWLPVPEYKSSVIAGENLRSDIIRSITEKRKDYLAKGDGSTVKGLVVSHSIAEVHDASLAKKFVPDQQTDKVSSVPLPPILEVQNEQQEAQLVADGSESLSVEPHVDFELPSPDTSNTHGVGSFNSGEGMAINVDMGSIHAVVQPTPSSTQPMNQSVVDTVMSKLPTLGFGRPSRG